MRPLSASAIVQPEVRSSTSAFQATQPFDSQRRREPICQHHRSVRPKTVKRPVSNSKNPDLGCFAGWRDTKRNAMRQEPGIAPMKGRDVVISEEDMRPIVSVRAPR